MEETFESSVDNPMQATTN